MAKRREKRERRSVVVEPVGVAEGLVWLANRFPWLHLDTMGIALVWLFTAFLAAAHCSGLSHRSLTK
jgi:hypothetical protein